ncbi:MAG: alanine--glyoxylate aminotransferase family protein, partial [Vicinamibacteria bacterium]
AGVFTRVAQRLLAMAALGLRLYAPDAPSDCVTAVLAPEGIDSGKIVKALREKHGVWIAGGQGEAKGKIFRVAHMGAIDGGLLREALGALEDVLLALGYKGAKKGAAVEAAKSIMESGESPRA